MIIKNVTKEQIENIVGRTFKFEYEFEPFWKNTRCEITKTNTNIDCMYYGKSTWSNKNGFLGGVSFTI
jgi:hypothetical protein